MNEPLHPTAGPNERADHDARPSNVRWQVFAVGCLTSWFLYVPRYVFGVLKPDLREAYNLTSQDLGYLDAMFLGF